MKGLVTEEKAKEFRRKRAGARVRYSFKVLFSLMKIANFVGALYGLNLVSAKLASYLVRLTQNTIQTAIFSSLAIGILFIMLNGKAYVSKEVK